MGAFVVERGPTDTAHLRGDLDGSNRFATLTLEDWSRHTSKNGHDELAGYFLKLANELRTAPADRAAAVVVGRLHAAAASFDTTGASTIAKAARDLARVLFLGLFPEAE